MFLHDAVLEAIICGDTEIATSKYHLKLIEMKEVTPNEQISDLQSQFDLLSHITPNPNHALCDTAKLHSNKNRCNKYLPCETIIL